MSSNLRGKGRSHGLEARVTGSVAALRRTHDVDVFQWASKLIVAVFACALLAGCAVDQQKEVELYRKILDARVGPPAAYAPDDVLALPHAMALANRNNEQLGLRGEEYVQSMIARSRAAAAFLPTVSLQPNFTVEQRAREDASTSTGPGGTGVGNLGVGAGSTTSGGGGFRNNGKVATRLEAPVVGNMNLFRGFGDLANLQSTETVIAERRALLRDAQSIVLLDVAQVYFQVLRSERAVEVLKGNIKVQEARLADVQQQFKNGLATQLAVSQTRAQVDATRATLVSAEGDIVNGRSTLAFVIGVDAVRGALRDDIPIPASSEFLTTTDYEAQASEHREDLQAAALAVAAAHSGVDVAVSQYYPSVSLNVAGFLYREFYSDASKWNAILSANLPIFTAGIIHADVRNAWSRLRQAALNESYLRRQIRQDVQIARQNLTTTDRRLKELEDQLDAAEDALRQAKNAFDNNLAINLDVLTAQDQVVNSELQLTSAQFDRAVFYLDLLRATGKLVDVFANLPATRPTSRRTTVPSSMSSTQPQSQPNSAVSQPAPVASQPAP